MIAGVLGLIFDTYDYDPSVTKEQIEIIDNFFESLKLDKLDPRDPGDDGSKLKAALTSVPYGQLMNMVATDYRWIYSGSLTTTPCTEGVYWNVVAKVYPIKHKHLFAFKRLLSLERTKEPNLADRKITEKGNYRVINPIKK